ncbi:MAG TPA: hypothetical protein RMF84_15080 [Polyangiaceae bacterium LLY-WYZ-14_1]|nr:hypothetical protein [Polyangiaceae bacterium LLY-WYZ-14_1]
MTDDRRPGRTSRSPSEGASGGDPFETGETPRRRLERLLGERVRRAVEKGLEAGLDTLSRTDGVVRGVVGDARVPREIVNYFFSQIDETKNATVRVMAREFRDFLEATDLSAVLQSALTSLSFEIRTEIRFIPNDKGGVRPSVKAQAASRRRGGRRQAGDDGPDAPDEERSPGAHGPEPAPTGQRAREAEADPTPPSPGTSQG